MDLDNILKLLQVLVLPAFYVGYKWVRSVEETIKDNKNDIEKKVSDNKAEIKEIVSTNKNEAEKVMEKHRTDNALTFQQHDLRLIKAEGYIVHLVKMGEDIKTQQSEQMLAVASIQQNIISISENMKTVIDKLEKYDENLTNFYKEYGLKKNNQPEQKK